MDEIDSQEIISYLENKLKSNLEYAVIFDDISKKYNKIGLSECFNYILLNKEEKQLLDYTIRKINELKYPQNLSALIDFLLNRDSGNYLDLKVLVIKTISNYKNIKAVPALMSCLNNKNSNYKIRFASAEALGKIGDKNAFESLSNIICDEEEKSVYVKESAVVALGMLGDNRALDVFNSILNTKQMFLEKFSFFKERIVEAISKMDISKNEKAINLLKTSLLDPTPRVRISTIETIMNSNIKDSYNLIYERLKFDDDLEVKKNALAALYNISDENILKEVMNGDFDKNLKDYANEIYNEYEVSDE